jgi:hypothetical protein
MAVELRSQLEQQTKLRIDVTWPIQFIHVIRIHMRLQCLFITLLKLIMKGVKRLKVKKSERSGPLDQSLTLLDRPTT